MKKIIIFLVFPAFCFAQKDSIKVSFSEEKVATFEASQIISICERMGVKRPVKAALKMGFESSPFMAQEVLGIFVLAYEQKIGKDFSLNMTYKIGNTGRKGFEVEPRWYFQMKKRVDKGLQAYNISGKYLSLKYKQSNLSTGNNLLYSYSPYHESSIYSFNFGQQFGNYLDLFFSAGFKKVRESFIDNRGFFSNNDQSPKSSTWFIASNSRVNACLSFPQFRTKKSEKFEKLNFAYNHIDINHLFKINLQNMLYIDRYTQYLKADIAYENRLGNSFFSSNSMLLGTINHFKFFIQKGSIDSVFSSKNSDFKIKIPIWENEKKTNLYSSFQITQQLRYYTSKKKEMKRGKSGKNFNGFYVGLEASYFYSTYKNDSYFKGYFTTPLNKNKQRLGIGGTIGLQNQFRNNLFFDWGLSYMAANNNSNITWVFDNFNPYVATYLKIGLAK